MNWIPTGYKCKTYSPIVHEAGACFLVYSTVPREDFEDAHVLRWTASCLGFDSAGRSGFWECALTHIVCCMEPDDGKAMQGTLTDSSTDSWVPGSSNGAPSAISIADWDRVIDNG